MCQNRKPPEKRARNSRRPVGDTESSEWEPIDPILQIQWMESKLLLGWPTTLHRRNHWILHLLRSPLLRSPLGPESSRSNGLDVQTNCPFRRPGLFLLGSPGSPGPDPKVELRSDHHGGREGGWVRTRTSARLVLEPLRGRHRPPPLPPQGEVLGIFRPAEEPDVAERRPRCSSSSRNRCAPYIPGGFIITEETWMASPMSDHREIRNRRSGVPRFPVCIHSHHSPNKKAHPFEMEDDEWHVLDGTGYLKWEKCLQFNIV